LRGLVIAVEAKTGVSLPSRNGGVDQRKSPSWHALSIKKAAEAALFSVLLAEMPLAIVAHIPTGRLVIVRPTLLAMGNSRIGWYHGADASLSTAESAAANLHRTAVELRGEGRRCDC
jgi:hypothetical protein